VSRSPRVVEPNGLYHVSPRGNDGRAIFGDEDDRRQHLALLTNVAWRFRWRVLGYCQMTTHYHLVVQLPYLGLSEGMRYLQHFEGRPIRSEGHLHATLRYVDLNPIVVNDVFRPEQWPWSSYRAHVGLEHPPAYLNLSAFHKLFADTPGRACRVYERFVQEGLALVSDTRARRRG
jgi:putative transposase